MNGKLHLLKSRRLIVAAIVLLVMGVFVARLISLQIIQSQELSEKLRAGSVSTQTVKSIRGEIVDRNGEAIVTNKLGYDIIIDMVSFPLATQNDVILSLIELFEQNNTEWIDNLPITQSAPYSYLNEKDAAVTRLKNFLEIAEYATAEDAMYHLTELYELQDYSEEQARKIAGVRYEMDRCGFDINVLYTFASDVDIDLVLAVKENGHTLPGVDVQESAIRSYAEGDLAPHLIGRVGPIYQEEVEGYLAEGYDMDDIVGKSGVESAFESDLRGEHGKRSILLDNSLEIVGAEDTVPAIPGDTVYLTIDADLQKVAQTALANRIKQLQTTAAPGMGKEANAGAAVAIDPNTGEVLACATYPSYDINTFSTNYEELSSDENLPLYNRALMGVYAPGSIFKPVVGTAGMSTGIIDEDTDVYCGRVYSRFTSHQFTCMYHHGDINLARALSVSCNIFFYEVGWNLGIDKIDLTAMQYGLGEPTGIELGESIGQRSNVENFEKTGQKWTDGNVIQSAIGQMVAQYTPLQLANYTATIANRGERMKVTILKEVRDYGRDKVIRTNQPQTVMTVDGEKEDFEAIIAGMVMASEQGTAAATFGNYPVSVAAKTGTPEAKKLNSTFICFAPVENPQIAIAVVIENGYHGYTSAPVAKAMFDEYFGYSDSTGLAPDEEEEEQSRPETSMVEKYSAGEQSSVSENTSTNDKNIQNSAASAVENR